MPKFTKMNVLIFGNNQVQSRLSCILQKDFVVLFSINANLFLVSVYVVKPKEFALFQLKAICNTVW